VPLAKVFGPLGDVTLQFGENLPLRLTFEFDDGEGKVEYFLAPRVEGDF
jgi:DNA polymerase III sliding clamp (beta) subunit (PCNA family)